MPGTASLMAFPAHTGRRANSAATSRRCARRSFHSPASSARSSDPSGFRVEGHCAKSAATLRRCARRSFHSPASSALQRPFRVQGPSQIVEGHALVPLQDSAPRRSPCALSGADCRCKTSLPGTGIRRAGTQGPLQSSQTPPGHRARCSKHAVMPTCARLRQRRRRVDVLEVDDVARHPAPPHVDPPDVGGCAGTVHSSPQILVIP